MDDSEFRSNVIKLLTSIDRKLSAPNQVPTTWDINDIANWLNLSSQTVRMEIINQEDFAPLINTTLNKKPRKHLWFAEDVIAWANKKKNLL